MNKRGGGWWTCPNDPPCPHSGVLHDTDEPGGREVCCVEGCECDGTEITHTKDAGVGDG